MEILWPLVLPLKSEIIEELSLKVHSLGTLHQEDNLMKSSSEHFFVGKERPKYLENPLRRITFVCMHILSFDRFYVVTKFELPKVKDLEFTTILYDAGCKHLDAMKSKERYPLGLNDDIKEYCVKIALHITYYKKENIIIRELMKF